jgi:hypothetical protein
VLRKVSSWHGGSVAAPVVSFGAEANVVATAGWSMTVTGVGFAPGSETASARVGLSSCGTTAWASGTAVVCLLAQGHGVQTTVVATVAGTVGSQTALFSYDGAKRETEAAWFAFWDPWEVGTAGSGNVRCVR